MECQSRKMYEFCGCIIYYMPHIFPNITICGRKDEICYERVKLNIELAFNKSYECKCYPGCFEVSYTSVLTSARIGYPAFFLRDLKLGNVTAEMVRLVQFAVFLNFS